MQTKPTCALLGICLSLSPMSPSLGGRHMPLHLAVLMGSVGPNAGPHACKASTVLTKPCLALKTLLALF